MTIPEFFVWCSQFYGKSCNVGVDLGRRVGSPDFLLECKIQRPFKVQKNGIFLFEISFCLEMVMFFYYANCISDDVILLRLKSGKN